MIREMFYGYENDRNESKAMLSVIWLVLGMIYLTNMGVYGQTVNEKDYKEEWTDRIDRIGEEWKTQKVEIENKYFKLVEDGKMTEEQAFKEMEKEADAWMKKRIKEEREKYEKELPTMPYKYFYGKVVDQNGEPVENADIDYGIFDVRKHTLTDINGFFKINEKGIRTLDVLIRGKDGYDAKSALPRIFYYEKDGSYQYEKEPRRAPDPNSPEIFKIRKKGEPTLLFTSGEEQHFAFNRQENQSYAVCLAGYVGRYPNMYMEKALSEKRRIDMVATAKFENGICKLIFEAVGANNAGLLVNEEQLYEAPANGYESKAAVDVEDKEGNRIKVFLYVKSGDPLIYSKVELEAVRTSTGLFVKYYSWTNPYGEKGLEQGRYMSRIEETYKKLKMEAADALTKGKYPPKPDFKALEAEGKKEYLKTHKDAR